MGLDWLTGRFSKIIKHLLAYAPLKTNLDHCAPSREEFFMNVITFKGKYKSPSLSLGEGGYTHSFKNCSPHLPHFFKTIDYDLKKMNKY